MSQSIEKDVSVGQRKRYLGGGGVWEVIEEDSKQTLKAKCVESGDGSQEGDIKPISKVIWTSGMYNPDLN